MKFKLFVVITNTDAFLKGDRSCLTLFDYEPGISDWINLGEIEFELDVNSALIVERTIAAIDKEIEEQQANFVLAIKLLEERKMELTALPAPLVQESVDSDPSRDVNDDCPW